jgi:thioredoxin 1
MKYLMTQDEFEELLKPNEPSFVAIYFGATWCGPCKRIDIAALDAMPGVNWLKCDVDQNPYTPGYCSVRSIPSFLVLANGKATGPIQDTDTGKIMEWVTEKRNEWIQRQSPLKGNS